MTGHSRLAPGVVHVRLTGHPGDAAALAALVANCPAVQVLTGPDGPYPNRRGPGHRLYLSVRLTQPPANDATPPRKKETPMSTDPAATANPEPEAAGPDTPIPYTLTPQAEAYLDSLATELSPAEPEPEASL